jgi:predicted RNase H-like HicB family nuclease
MPVRYPVYTETGLEGQAVSYVFRLPGLYVEAAAPERALALLPAAIAMEHEWLARHGVPPPDAGIEIEVDEVERIDLRTDVSRGMWRGLFQYELRATRDADVALAVESARFARQDVLAAVERAGAQARAALEPRLRGHADAEWELLSRLGTRLSGTLPDDALARLAAVRERAEDRLAHLLPGDRERLAVFGGEKWTARKVLRCYAVGERRLLRAAEVELGQVQSPR